VFGIKVVFKGVTKKPCYSIARYINCYRQFTITTFDLASTMLLIFLVASFQLICVVVHTTDGTEELPVRLPVSKPSLYSLFSDWFYSVQKLIQTSIKSGDLDIHWETQRVHSGVGDYNAA
jgi:hypothetical protein